MPKYSVKALYSCKDTGRVWFEVEAKNKKEALERAKNHDYVGIDYKSDETDEYDFDFDDAEVELA